MVVLHVSQPTDAGVARYVASIAPRQIARGWRVVVACPPGPLATDAVSAGAEHVAWDAGRSPGPSSLAETRRLRRLVDAVCPDLVHLHSAKAGLAGRLARLPGPVVYQPHAWSFEAVGGTVKRAARAWERNAARRCDALICVSETEMRAGLDAGVVGPYVVIHNGVDLSQLQPADDDQRAAARDRLGLLGGPLVVCVGRLSRQKGQDVLLRAWPVVQQRVFGASLVLVGDGPERAALEGLTEEGVVLVGQRDDVADWIAAADVIVIPSRWEGMSLLMLEAMARARSIVATDVAGAREALGTEAGTVIPPEDPGALADAVTARLLDPKLARREGQAGRSRAEEMFDIARTEQALAETYARILGEAAQL